MTATAPEDDPIELHLPDGGHVIVAIRDEPTRLSADCDELIGTLLHADGSEHDIEREIRTLADGMGLHCESSSSRNPTVIVIRVRGRSPGAAVADRGAEAGI